MSEQWPKIGIKVKVSQSSSEQTQLKIAYVRCIKKLFFSRGGLVIYEQRHNWIFQDEVHFEAKIVGR